MKGLGIRSAFLARGMKLRGFSRLVSRDAVGRTKRKDLTATPAGIRKTSRSLSGAALSLERSNGYL